MFTRLLRLSDKEELVKSEPNHNLPNRPRKQIICRILQNMLKLLGFRFKLRTTGEEEWTNTSPLSSAYPGSDNVARTSEQALSRKQTRGLFYIVQHSSRRPTNEGGAKRERPSGRETTGRYSEC